MAALQTGRMIEKIRQRGVSTQVLETLRHSGIDLDQWLTGFDSVAEGVRRSVEMIRRHPLLPRHLPVHGLLMHPVTGDLELLADGYATATT